MDAEQCAELFQAHFPREAECFDGVDRFHVAGIVAYNATACQEFVARRPNDSTRLTALVLRMSQHAVIHGGKTPNRNHFIKEWAAVRDKRQTDFVQELGVDKATVSRWFNGTIPTPENLERVVAFLQLEDITALFRHPDDDWLARFLQGRGRAEKDRIRATLEAAFPKTGTAG